MSEQEFETYLKLLRRLLNLSESQRSEIADEFRSHFDQRVEELVTQGKDSEAAIRAALREFGDASALAQELTRISRLRKRRMIMRTSIGTVAACVAIAFFVPQLLPVAAVQQEDDAAAVQHEPNAGEAPATDYADAVAAFDFAVQNADSDEDATGAGQSGDNPFSEVFADGTEIKVIDLVAMMPRADAEVCRTRAAEVATTIRTALPEGFRTSSADGLIIIFGSDWEQNIAEHVAERMVDAWNERDDLQRAIAEKEAEDRIRRLRQQREELEEEFSELHESLGYLVSDDTPTDLTKVKMVEHEIELVRDQLGENYRALMRLELEY